MSIYVSTGAFRSRRLIEILTASKDTEITNIELAPGLVYDSMTIDYVRLYHDRYKFLIHNYFPSPKYPFGLNLASTKENTIKKSLEMCKANIDLCAELEIPIYSIHCGFCFDTDGTHLGNESQVNLSSVALKVAKSVFVENLVELCDYAAKKNIIIAIENNVVAEYSARNADLYLGVTGDDMSEILNTCKKDNLRILLDLAHAKVSSTFLGFDVTDMINMLRDDIIEVHISDNNGLYDQNLPLDNSSEVGDWLQLLKDKVWTLEAYNLGERMIIEQIDLLKKMKGIME